MTVKGTEEETFRSSGNSPEGCRRMLFRIAPSLPLSRDQKPWGPSGPSASPRSDRAGEEPVSPAPHVPLLPEPHRRRGGLDSFLHPSCPSPGTSNARRVILCQG